MKIYVEFLGLSLEAAKAKGVPKPEHWNANATPFQLIEAAVFELFEGTHKQIKCERAAEPADLNLFVCGLQRISQTQTGASIEKPQVEGEAKDQSYIRFQQCRKEAPERTVLLAVLMPSEEEGMGGLYDADHPQTGPMWPGLMEPLTLLPFYGVWNTTMEETKDLDNYQLTYPRPDTVQAEDMEEPSLEYLKILSKGAFHNLRSMQMIKISDAAVFGAKAKTLEQQYNELYVGCAYCKGQQQTQIGCGYCKGGKKKEKEQEKANDAVP